MSKWDFFVVAMGLTLMGCSVYAAIKAKFPGCLITAACCLIMVVAVLTHPHKTAPFCEIVP